MIDRLAAAAGRDVPRETVHKLELYVDLLADESTRQNLVSAATLHAVWDRHIVDSAQLVRFEPGADASWVDIGSGAGFPGIVVSLLVEGAVTLIEPRRLRAQFLEHVVEELGIANRVRVACAKAERVEGRFDVITARAIANLGRTLEISRHLSTKNSLWVLPKGRTAESELAEAQRAWQGDFRLEPSITDADARIVVATGVRART